MTKPTLTTTPGTHEKAPCVAAIDLGGPNPTSGIPRDPLDQIRAVSGGLEKSVGRVEEYYIYETAEGDPYLVVFRCWLAMQNKKTFRQYHFKDGKLTPGGIPGTILYDLPGIVTSDEVILVEGEKAMNALRRHGFCATTVAGGADKFKAADYSALKGKTVYLWPDNDDPGRAAMQAAEKKIKALGPDTRVRIIDESGLAKKEDAADVVARLEHAWLKNNPDMVRQILFTAYLDMSFSGVASKDLMTQIEQEIEGTRQSVPFPYPLLSGLTNANLPGKVVLVCGDPGSGKSFFLTSWIVHWFDMGLPIAAYELEEAQTFWLRRAIVYSTTTEGDKPLWGILHADWVRKNPDRAREIIRTLEPWCQALGENIYTKDRGSVTFAELTRWARERAEAGCRILIIDPISLAEYTAADSWNEDKQFINDLKDIADEYGCTVIAVTHPKAPGTVGLQNLAGAQAYGRLAQTVLWVQKVGGLFEVEGLGQEQLDFMVHIEKCRDGKGNGKKIGYKWDSTSLKFTERGILV